MRLPFPSSCSPRRPAFAAETLRYVALVHGGKQAGQQIKIYNSFPKTILRDTAAYAHERGLRVSGHVPAFMRAQDVMDQGYDEIQHINQVMLNFFVTPEADTRTLQRFYLVAEKTDGLDFDSKPV